MLSNFVVRLRLSLLGALIVLGAPSFNLRRAIGIFGCVAIFGYFRTKCCQSSNSGTWRLSIEVCGRPCGPFFAVRIVLRLSTSHSTGQIQFDLVMWFVASEEQKYQYSPTDLDQPVRART